jgi:hypothetical protein
MSLCQTSFLFTLNASLIVNHTQTSKDTQLSSHTEIKASVCVCVCVKERESERERVQLSTLSTLFSKKTADFFPPLSLFHLFCDTVLRLLQIHRKTSGKRAEKERKISLSLSVSFCLFLSFVDYVAYYPFLWHLRQRVRAAWAAIEATSGLKKREC